MKIFYLVFFRTQLKCLRGTIILLSFFILLTPAFSQTQTKKGKLPVIIIPGITGSQIVNLETKKTIWFTFGFSRDEFDDLRLPMSTNLKQNTDSLVAGDIIREIKLPGVLKIFPEIGVYENALKALKENGYTEGDWDNPQSTDVFYVFGYDWRRDNVETAQILLEKIEVLKTKLNLPELKFNLIAHSMGGLIARYAAMYGKADLPKNGSTPSLTWAGARHINKILLFGVPNEGSFSAFEVLIKGYSLAGRKLPFVRDLGPDDVFSIPSIYQLLPNVNTSGFVNRDLKPIRIDIFNPANWIKYNWGAISDPKFLGKLKDAAKIPKIKPIEWKIKNSDDKILSETTYQQAQQFLGVVLKRAKSFQLALGVNVTKSPIEFLAYGSECEPTLNAVVLIFDSKKKVWHTLTEAEKIKNSKGHEISKDEMKKVMFADGDGRITRSSFLPVIKTGKAIVKYLIPTKKTFFACSEHQKLLNDPTIQSNYLTELADEIKQN